MLTKDSIEIHVYGNFVPRKFEGTHKDFILLKKDIDKIEGKELMLEISVKTQAANFNLFYPKLKDIIGLTNKDKQKIENDLIDSFKQHGLKLFREKDSTFFHIRYFHAGEKVLLDI